jgi:flagellar basal body-associated protein FliL
MVAKLTLVLLTLAVVLLAAVVGAYRYFSQQERHRHEKEMFRERRDAALLDDDRSALDRELARERQRDRDQPTDRERE